MNVLEAVSITLSADLKRHAASEKTVTECSLLLAELFKVLKKNIRVVVLNACFSEAQANAIVEEIDFAVGMSDSIGDEAARIFAAAFYRGLAFGKSMQTAFDLGLNELKLMNLKNDEDVPILLVRNSIDASIVTICS